MTLTDEQEAVLASQSNLDVCLAGPGSGKTTTIVEMVKRMDPDEAAKTAILTFTCAGAGEIKRRIGIERKLFFSGTTHAYCRSLLSREGTRIGLQKSLSVLSQDAATELRVECINFLKYRGEVDFVTDEIERNPKVQADPQPLKDKRAFDVAMLYHQKLIEGAMLDYDALLTYGLFLLQKGVMWRPSTILIDEAQDSSELEWSIYRSMKARRYAVVGDLDQSIFEWRGAAPGKLLSICKSDKSTVHMITRNHRSGPVICDAATRIISNNFDRMNKPVVSAYAEGGEIEQRRFKNRGFELAWIVDWARKNVDNDVAILCRWNAGCAEVRNALSEAEIKIQGRADKPENLSKAMAFLSACNDPANNQVLYMWMKKANGAVLANNCKRMALDEVKPMAAFCNGELPGNWCKVRGNSVEMLVPEDERINRIIPELLRFGEETTLYINKVLEQSGPFESIPDLIVALGEDVQETKEKGIWVSTIHKAKGLEWTEVFLPFWTEKVFPGRQMSEEERRLAFVALTRAKNKAVISWTEMTSLWKDSPPVPTGPSRFIRELETIKT